MLSETIGEFGKTGVKVNGLGFGAAPIGNLYRKVEEKTAREAIQTALEMGFSYFDVAPYYGMGTAETRLGQGLGGQINNVVISTKVGRILKPMHSAPPALHYGFVDTPPLEPIFDYSYDGVMRSFESSLSRLKCDHVHLLLAHDLGEVTHGDQHPFHYKQFLDGGYRAMDELRSGGAVSALGIGANEWQICISAMGYADFDCFLLAGRYTLLDHESALETFMPECEKRDVTIVLGGPFNSGILATGVKNSLPDRPPTYNYEAAPQTIIDKVAAIETLCESFSVPLAAAALQFPLAHPQVCNVLAGYSRADHVERAVTLMNTPIPTEFWGALKSAGLLHVCAPTA